MSAKSPTVVPITISCLVGKDALAATAEKERLPTAIAAIKVLTPAVARKEAVKREDKKERNGIGTPCQVRIKLWDCGGGCPQRQRLSHRGNPAI